MGWWGDFKRKTGLNKLAKNLTNETGKLADNLLGDEFVNVAENFGESVAQPVRELGRFTDNYQNAISENPLNFFNPLSWQATPGKHPPGAGPDAPDLAGARERLLARMAARRPRMGAASSILSERPASALGYTGGGMVSNVLLGGA